MKKVSDLKNAILYAQALYEGAEKAGDIELAHKNISVLKSVIAENSDNFMKINNPLGKLNDKIQILEFLAQKLDLTTSMVNLLKILAQQGKLNLLAQVLQQFNLLYNNKHGIAEVEITTVTPLSEKQKILLKEKLAAIFNKQITLNYIINPQIIGGLVIRYGTNFIDNSIKHKLNALEQMMKGKK